MLSWKWLNQHMNERLPLKCKWQRLPSLNVARKNPVKSEEELPYSGNLSRSPSPSLILLCSVSQMSAQRPTSGLCIKHSLRGGQISSVSVFKKENVNYSLCFWWRFSMWRHLKSIAVIWSWEKGKLDGEKLTWLGRVYSAWEPPGCLLVACRERTQNVLQSSRQAGILNFIYIYLLFGFWITCPQFHGALGDVHQGIRSIKHIIK